MKYFTTALIVLLIVFGCSNQKSKNFTSSNNFKAMSPKLAQERIEPVNNKFESDRTKLIKTGKLKFETKSIEGTFANIKKQLQNLKGYIQFDETNKSYNRITRTLIVRIPKNAFQNIIDSISREVSFFDIKQIKLRDVTEEYIDVNARIKTKKKLENRYLALLQKAKTVKEMLAIEHELSLIREEIDAKQGRLNYLESKINLSTLTIVFYKKTVSKQSKKNTYLNRIKQAFSTGFNIMGNIVIVIFSVWPLLIIGFLVYLWILKKSRRKKN